MTGTEGPEFASPEPTDGAASREPIDYPLGWEQPGAPQPATGDASPTPPAMVMTGAPETPAPRGRRGRGRRAVRALGWTFAGAGVAALAAFSGYLWLTHEQWVDQNDQLRAEALELGEKLAQSRLEAEQAQASLTTTSDQLDEAKSTISTLADQDANATDGQRYAEEIAEWALECADERDVLVDYLKESWRYTDASLRNAESNINEYCADAADAWAEYQADKE